MDVSKILFNFLKTDKIKSEFEDLDINGDGKINNQDESAAQNTALAAEIQALLNSVDPELQLVEDKQDTNLFSNMTQVSLNNLQSEVKTLENKIEEKEDEYKSLADKIEEKQEEYETIMEQIEEAKEDENTSSLQSKAESLASDIRLLGMNLTNLVSNINILETQYSNKQKQLEIEQAAAKKSIASAAKTGTTKSGDATNNDDTQTTTDSTSTPTTSSCPDSSALYVEGKGVNIGKVADLIWGTYRKVSSDATLNEKFKNSEYYNSKSGRALTSKGGELGFAINYLLTQGTEEQQNAIKGLFKNTSQLRWLHLSFSEKIPGTSHNRYSKEAFIKKYALYDVDGDGFIAQTEIRQNTWQNSTGRKWLSSSGKIDSGRFVLTNPDNVFSFKEIPPHDGITHVSGIYTTTINGTKVYGLQTKGKELGSEITLNLSQSELEKLSTYFDTAGDNASINGALEAMGISAKKTPAYRRKGYTYNGKSGTGYEYTFKGESGLESSIKLTSASDSGLKGKELKLFELLKAMSLGAANNTLYYGEPMEMPKLPSV